MSLFSGKFLCFRTDIHVQTCFSFFHVLKLLLENINDNTAQTSSNVSFGCTLSQLLFILLRFRRFYFSSTFAFKVSNDKSGNMTKPTRWGFMGCGRIASDFANAMQLLPKTEHEITAVAATDLKRAKEFADKFQAKHAFEGYEYVANCPEVDIIYVSVINPSHVLCVGLALNAGKSVLCEKPMGMNAKQVREMIQLAKHKRVFFMEAFWSRCFPIYEEIRQALKDGQIGEPKFLQGNFGMAMDPKDNARVLEKKLGGSCLLDLGCYLIMLTTRIFNGQLPQSIQATGKLNSKGVDVMNCVTLRYKNDAVAQLMISSEVELAQRVIVFGTKGSLELPASFNNPDKVIINSKLIEHPLPPAAEGQYFYPNSQGLSYEICHIRECLLKGLKESPLMPLEHTDVIASIMDEVRRQVGCVYADEQ